MSAGAGARSRSSSSTPAMPSATAWRRTNANVERQLRRLPPQSWRLVRYEDLCASPQGTADAIATFLGAHPSRLPPDLQGPSRHIMGNKMRLSGGAKSIHLDEKWRGAMAESDVATVVRIAGAMARRYGYHL